MDSNKDILNTISDSNRRFAKKKREEDLLGVPEKVAAELEKAMEQEDNGYFDKAKDICVQILATEEGRNVEKVILTLARIYPKVLETDIYDCNKRYQTDVEDYFKFLDSITMNDLMQEYVVETLAKFCELMENEWYRPLFREFVATVEKKGYLTKEEYRKTLDSAYASAESVVYFDDNKVSIIMKNVLKSGYERAYVLTGVEETDKRQKMEMDIYTNIYYLCCYYDDNTDEVEYIKSAYPHSYETIEKDVEEIKSDKQAKISKTLDKLAPFAAKNIDREALKTALDKAYQYVLNSHKQPELIHSGKQPYYRKNTKIGRNDLCPCGSGRKYKQCCGRDVK